MPTMAASTINLKGLDLVLALHTPEDILAEEYRLYLEMNAKLLQLNGGSPERIRNLVITDGGAPTAKQRGQFSEVFGGQAVRVAVITTVLTNPVKRGIATAIGWVNPEFKAVPPNQWREAFLHVNMESEVQSVLYEFARLQAKLPINDTLELVNASSTKRVA